MSVHKILTTDNKMGGGRADVLKTPASPVEDFGSLETLIGDMIETMWADPICVGLAAPQIGIGLQVALVCPSKVRDDLIVIINPTEAEAFGQKDIKRESCMSLPDRAGNVERRKKLRIVCSDRTGAEVQYELEGFVARVAAHELDHLNGQMYCDRLTGPLMDMSFDDMRRRIADELNT